MKTLSLLLVLCSFAFAQQVHGPSVPSGTAGVPVGTGTELQIRIDPTHFGAVPATRLSDAHNLDFLQTNINLMSSWELLGHGDPDYIADGVPFSDAAVFGGVCGSAGPGWCFGSAVDNAGDWTFFKWGENGGGTTGNLSIGVLEGSGSLLIKMGGNDAQRTFDAWKVTPDGTLAPGAVLGNGTTGATGLLKVAALVVNDPSPSIPKPTCDAGHRNWIWTTDGGAGVADTTEVCRKDAANVYAWTAIY